MSQNYLINQTNNSEIQSQYIVQPQNIQSRNFNNQNQYYGLNLTQNNTQDEANQDQNILYEF